MHVVSEIEQTAHVKRRRREIQCDRQMDLSLPVNQISGGGDAAVACLAYFPPFISQFILLGRLEVRYMKGVQPRLACHHNSKEMAALIKQEGMGGESACKGKKWTARSSFPSLHSPFALTPWPYKPRVWLLSFPFPLG